MKIEKRKAENEMLFQTEFSEIVNLIKKSRSAAMRTVNSALINLYWQIGEFISKRVKNEDWGKIRRCRTCRICKNK